MPSMVSVMLDWFTELLPGDGSIRIFDNSEETSIIAIQGPKSMEIVSQVLGEHNKVGKVQMPRNQSKQPLCGGLDTRNGIYRGARCGDFCP